MDSIIYNSFECKMILTRQELDKLTLQEFLSESEACREEDDKCAILVKWFKFKTTDDGHNLYLIKGKNIYDLWIKKEIDVDDCNNALAYLRILCQNLLNKMY